MSKRVPDWLNNALWSAPSPHNDAATADPPSPRPPPTVATPPETPASSYADAHDAEGEHRDPLSSLVSDNYASACCSDEEDGRASADSMASAAVTPPSAKDFTRQNQILNEFSKKVIDMGEIRKLALQGIPDGAGIRATVWKLLLGYLPADRSLWPSELAKKRSQYKQFKEELLVNPSEITRRLEESSLENHQLDEGSPRFLSRSEISHGEHPLSLGKTSIWNQFFQETEVVEQIDRDVMRTHPDINFFSGDSTFAKSNQDSAEADTFFCFVELLSGLRGNFVQQLDNSVVGIRATITRLSQMLKDHDEELCRHLELTTKVLNLKRGFERAELGLVVFSHAS